ncbi:MAG: rod-binding protein [Candidatus Competibacter sp.]
MDSDQSRLYRDMYDQQIALSMAQQGKLGLADTIARQLGGEGAGTPSRPVSPEMVGDPLATLRQVQRIRSSVAMPADDGDRQARRHPRERAQSVIRSATRRSSRPRRRRSCGGCGRTPRRPPAGWASRPRC